MTEKAYPFSTGPGAFVTEEDWAAMTEGYQDTGVYGHPGTTDLTIEPGPEPNTIQVNVGDAQVSGFHYRLTAPKVISTVANAGATDRTDLVVLQLDEVTKTITPVLLTEQNGSNVGPDRCPIGLWTQPPAAEVTAEDWGTATDARWFIGNRVRPYLPTAMPPASPGGMIYDASADGAGTVFLGKLDSNGQPFWSPWYPISSERIEVKEAGSSATQQTTSTAWIAGSPQVSTTFEAPPSGQVFITVYAQLEAQGSSSAYCGFEIREENASGAVVVAPNVDDAAGQQMEYWSGSTRRKLISGLTPGETYFVRTMHRSDRAGVQIIIIMRSILVEPVYTEVAPGAPEPGDVLDPGDVVLTAGGSSIRIPDGNVTTQALNIRIPAGDRPSAPDTFAIFYNTGTDAAPVWERTGYFNEYGELRVIPSAPTRVPVRIRLLNGQTNDAFQVADLNNIPMAGFAADGTVYAPNIGNARVFTGPKPLQAEPGDLWINPGTTPPTLNMRVTGGWSPLQGGTVVPDATEAPTFVDADGLSVNSTSITLPATDGDTLVACIGWNTQGTMTPPAGWTLLRSYGASGSRSALYVAQAAEIASNTFTLTGTAALMSCIVLGYTAATVLDSDGTVDDINGNFVAPALAVNSAPAVVARFYWGRGSTITSLTKNDATATLRREQYGGVPTSIGMMATGQTVATPQTVPLATATANVTAGDAGGYTVALVAA
ncbi:hypothetical protein E1264_03505 [Actinomadura sp. KC216]|uniref:hypothetical protein n=1 Tax=Actinomadura sp. KC216 TaxID=2530370 RepID=UPI001048ADD5|nr:hypothetical protein [Actinomadura sp. KC216]TDB90904.1 hypothetical protein E1264_03505 [Actinomadura sp. KC216]